MKKKPRFQGEVYPEPVVYPEQWYDSLKSEEVRRYNRKLALVKTADEFQKLSQLLDHYGINGADENCWLTLSLNLAREYVTGFAPQKRPGRKSSEWNMVVLTYLNWRVAELQSKNPRLSVMSACRQLVNDPILHGSDGEPRNAVTLRNKYHESTRHEGVQWMSAGKYRREPSGMASLLVSILTAHKK